MKEKYSHTAEELRDSDKAWEDLYNHASPLIMMILRKGGVPESEIPDLQQEVFLRTHTALSRLRPQDNPVAYISRIAQNIAVDYYRSQRRRGGVYSLEGMVNNLGNEISEDGNIALVDHSISPEERVIQEEEVAEVMGHLRPKEQILFVMKSQGYKSKDLPGGVATAKTRIFRAREKLAKLQTSV